VDKVNLTKILISLMLKLLVFASLSFATVELIVYTLSHVAIATYAEPLSPEQIRLKDIFLKDEDTPGLITEWEKQIIAEEVRAEVKIFGITIKELTIYRLNMFLVVFSALSITSFLSGWAAAISARNKTRNWKLIATLKAAALCIILLLLWRIHGVAITQVMSLFIVISIGLGLLNWPLWALIDKIFGKLVPP
jgi:hypothetical protein